MSDATDAAIGAVAVVVLILLVVVLVVLFKGSDDDARLDRVTVDGVDCVVVRNGLGRVKYVDCDWSTP